MPDLNTQIKVTYSDCTEGIYDSVEEAELAILEAHAEGAEVERVTNEDESVTYSCMWDVKLQKEV